MQERRKITRWQIDQHAMLKLERATKDLFCQIKDINYTGAKIVLNARLPEDTAFKMSLRLSEDCTINAEVWIAWRKIIDGINHYGVYFSSIKDADKDKIYKFINFHCPEDSEQKWELKPVEAEIGQGGDDMNDHRIFERFGRQFSVRFIGLNDGNEGLAQTFDVSAKGLGLSTTYELKPQSDLEIWLDVPNSTDPLYTRGQVVWSRPQGKDGYRSGVELERADLMGISRLLRA